MCCYFKRWFSIRHMATVRYALPIFFPPPPFASFHAKHQLMFGVRYDLFNIDQI